MNLTEGCCGCAIATSWERPTPLVPGEVYAVTVELFPTAQPVRRGHRLRLDIAGSNFPHFDINPNSGEPEGSMERPRIAHTAIFVDRGASVAPRPAGHSTAGRNCAKTGCARRRGEGRGQDADRVGRGGCTRGGAHQPDRRRGGRRTISVPELEKATARGAQGAAGRGGRVLVRRHRHVPDGRRPNRTRSRSLPIGASPASTATAMRSRSIRWAGR